MRSYSFCPKSRGAGAGWLKSRSPAGAVVMVSLSGAVWTRRNENVMPGFLDVSVAVLVQVRVLGFES